MCELSPATVLPERTAADLFRVSLEDFAARFCALRVSQSGVAVTVLDRVSTRQTPGRDRDVTFRARTAELQQLHDLSCGTH